MRSAENLFTHLSSSRESFSRLSGACWPHVNRDLKTNGNNDLSSRPVLPAGKGRLQEKVLWRESEEFTPFERISLWSFCPPENFRSKSCFRTDLLVRHLWYTFCFVCIIFSNYDYDLNWCLLNSALKGLIVKLMDASTMFCGNKE